jgi:hypothetical protein
MNPETLVIKYKSFQKFWHLYYSLFNTPFHAELSITKFDCLTTFMRYRLNKTIRCNARSWLKALVQL